MAYLLATALLCTTTATHPGTAAAEETPSYTIETFLGGAVPDSVPALDVNVWPSSVLARPGGSVLVLAYARLRRFTPGGIMQTVAGHGMFAGEEDNGGDPLDADLRGFWDMTTGPDGLVYFSESGHHVIRRIEADGTVHTVAGRWGVEGVPWDGEGLPATEARFTGLRGLDFGPDGSLFFGAGLQVRRIRPDGILETVAGNAETTVVGTGDGGPALEASLKSALDVVVDTLGRVYIADVLDSRVRRVELDGTITTFAGALFGFDAWGDGGPATEAGLGAPEALAFQSDGSLLIADSRHGLIRRVDTNGIIWTLAGVGERGFSGDGGPASSAHLGDIHDLSLDECGNIYIADNTNFRVRRIDPAGIIETVAGNGTKNFAGDGGPASEASIGEPVRIVVRPNGEVLLAETSRHVRHVDTDGIIHTIAGNGTDDLTEDGVPATETGVDAIAIAEAPDGSIYTIETGPRIRRVDPDGIIHFVAGGELSGFAGDGGPAEDALLWGPTGIDVGTDGSVYIADTENSRLRRIDPAGIIDTIAGNGERSSTGDGGPAALATLNRPTDVFVDASGAVFVSEVSGYRIRRIGTDGVIQTVAGTGPPPEWSGDGGPATDAKLWAPWGLGLGADGVLYIADTGNLRVRRVGTDGIIHTIAGNGELYYNGDGMPALEAALRRPIDVAAGPDGRVYVVDSFQGRVRVLIPEVETPAAFYDLRARRTEQAVELQWQSSTTRAVVHLVQRAPATAPERFEERGRIARDRAGAVDYVDETGNAAFGSSALYRVVVTTQSGDVLTTLGPVTVTGSTPRARATLTQYPNPFNPRGTFVVELAAAGWVELTLYDAAGRRVRELVGRRLAAGHHERHWDGRDALGHAVGSGVYHAVLRVDGRRAQNRAVTILR